MEIATIIGLFVIVYATSLITIAMPQTTLQKIKNVVYIIAIAVIIILIIHFKTAILN